MSWGTETFIVENVESTDDMIDHVDQQLLRIGRLAEGDTVVIVAGTPPEIEGSTNMIRVHRIGERDH